MPIMNKGKWKAQVKPRGFPISKIQFKSKFPSHHFNNILLGLNLSISFNSSSKPDEMRQLHMSSVS